MESEQKEYGKLSVEQFQSLVQTLPGIRKDIEDMPALLRTSPKAKAFLDKDFYWAGIYELPFEQQIAMLVCALGQDKKLHEVAQSHDPQQAALDWADTDDGDDEWAGGTGGIFTMKHVIGFFTALQRNILSIMLFHRTLDKFVTEVKQGNTAALFQAVRVDRSIMSCPTFSDRIARAELENDKTFFLHLRSALKGPSKKLWEAYRDLRYSLCVLREMGFDKMSDAQLEDLLVHKLKVYPNNSGARKNLRKQFTESKKFSTTSK